MASNRFLNAGGVYTTRNYVDVGSDVDLTLLTQEVNKLKIKVTADEETIANHTTKIETMEPLLNVVDETVDDHAVRIGVLEAKVDSNQNRFTTIETNITNIENNIETNITNIETSINNNSNNISELESNVNTINTTLTDYNSRIVTLEGNFADGDADATVFEQRLTTAESNINNNTTIITQLDTNLTTAESNIENNTTKITKLDTNLTKTRTKLGNLQTNLIPEGETCNCEDYLLKLENVTSVNGSRLRSLFFNFTTFVGDFMGRCSEYDYSTDYNYLDALRTALKTIRDSRFDSYTYSDGTCEAAPNTIHTHATNLIEFSYNNLLNIYNQLNIDDLAPDIASHLAGGNLIVQYREKRELLLEDLNNINNLPRTMPTDHDEKMYYLWKIAKVFGDYLIAACTKIKELLYNFSEAMTAALPNLNDTDSTFSSWQNTQNEAYEFTEGCLVCYGENLAIPTIYQVIKKIIEKTSTSMGYEWKYYDAENNEKIYSYNTSHQNVEIKDYIKNFTENIIQTLADWFNSNCSTFIPGEVSE